MDFKVIRRALLVSGVALALVTVATSCDGGSGSGGGGGACAEACQVLYASDATASLMMCGIAVMTGAGYDVMSSCDQPTDVASCKTCLQAAGVTQTVCQEIIDQCSGQGPAEADVEGGQGADTGGGGPECESNAGCWQCCECEWTGCAVTSATMSMGGADCQDCCAVCEAGPGPFATGCSVASAQGTNECD